MKILVIYDDNLPVEKMRSQRARSVRFLEQFDEGGLDATYVNVADFSVRIPKDQEIGKVNAQFRKLVGDAVDAVVMHFSFLGIRNMGLGFFRWKRQFQWLEEMSAVKVAIPQDEGNNSDILDEWLAELGVSAIFSVHYAADRPLYRIMRHRAAIYQCFPGYVDETLVKNLRPKVTKLKDREVDLVYRARKLKRMYGSAAKVKAEIGQAFVEGINRAGLSCDISVGEESTIFGDKWYEFLANGRAALGAPGGYSVLNRRGELDAYDKYLRRVEAELSEEEYAVAMQKEFPDWNQYEFLTVTPRHFEYAIAGTAQVLVRNAYKGVLVAEEHYLPVERDFRNVDEIVDRLRDETGLQDMVDRTFEELCVSGQYSYRCFAKRVVDAVVCPDVETECESRCDKSLEVARCLTRRAESRDLENRRLGWQAGVEIGRAGMVEEKAIEEVFEYEMQMVRGEGIGLCLVSSLLHENKSCQDQTRQWREYAELLAKEREDEIRKVMAERDSLKDQISQVGESMQIKGMGGVRSGLDCCAVGCMSVLRGIRAAIRSRIRRLGKRLLKLG